MLIICIKSYYQNKSEKFSLLSQCDSTEIDIFSVKELSMHS